MTKLDIIHRKIEKCSFGPGEEKEFTDTLKIVEKDDILEKGMYVYTIKRTDPMAWFKVIELHNDKLNGKVIEIINEVGDDYVLTMDQMAHTFMYDEVKYLKMKRNEKLEDLGI